MFGIVELDEELREAREEAGLDKDRVITRTAAANKEKTIESLLQKGFNTRIIGDALDAPYVVVERIASRLEREKDEADKWFLFPESEGGYYAIYNS
jgi:hypothetical protein